MKLTGVAILVSREVLPAAPAAYPYRSAVEERTMGILNRVVLPKTQSPVFPDVCVICTLPNPGSTIPFSEGSFEVAVPICGRCAPRIRWREIVQRWLFRVGMVCGLVAAIVAFSIFGAAGSQGKALALVIGLGSIVPWLIFTWVVPLPLMVVTSSDDVLFEFRDAHYAAEFATLNGTRTGPKVQS